ncbi:hypothetical protein Vadar_007465 [Vaccinium darrowii]|uniref:Uncharacterized protein n=1 Tax=Vaccinium darrowii TaxID=229202 RepID=A0ACB7ZIR7_9ERIC|nr:hypothetical protein Vadar_007465 [Vaccinium darrowii]
MCYVVESNNRRLVLPVRRAEEVVVIQQAPIQLNGVATTRGGSGSGGGGGDVKQCICSPTRHPGSFRCRHHHAEYEWGRRGPSKGCK